MSQDRDRLSEYRAKRDPAASGEPAGRRRAGHGTDGPRFVVQRHDASTLHFDFRLEIDGVLVSWSVPKGPSTDPRDKRLAIRTEDHPPEYAEFEGEIPAGRYGAGTVVVWDTGTFDNLTEHDGEPVGAAAAVDRGHIVVSLAGHKITGGYALTRTGTRGHREQWLLVKTDDEGADRRRKPVRTQPESVLTGRTNDEPAGG